MRALVRAFLRWLLPLTGLRGRHRIADAVGAWAAPHPPEEAVDINGIRVLIDHRLQFSRQAYYGLYEEHFVGFLRRTLQPGDAFLDLGANIGYITAVAHGLVGDRGMVAAFEPSRTCYSALVRLNPTLPPGVRLFHAAIMERSGTHAFMDTPRVVSRGFSVLLLEPRTPDPGASIYDIETIAIDDAVAQLGLTRIACIKMDIEGAEWSALRGAERTLQEGIADHIMVETSTLNEGGKARAQRIAELLRRHGYSPFLPTRRGRLRPFAHDLHQRFRADVIWKHDRIR